MSKNISNKNFINIFQKVISSFRSILYILLVAIITISCININDINASEITSVDIIDREHIRITPGYEFSTTVSIDSNVNISGYQLSFIYNTDNFDLVSIDKNPYLPGELVYNSNELGEIYVTYSYVDTYIYDFTDLFEINFLAKSDIDYQEKQLLNVNPTYEQVISYSSDNNELLEVDMINFSLSTIDVGLYGDINADNTVNIIDVAFLQQYMVGTRSLTSIQTQLADVNVDGFTDMIDIAYIQQYIVQTREYLVIEEKPIKNWILPDNLSNLISVKENLKNYYSSTLENETYVVTDDLNLLESIGGLTITWESNNTDYLANDGTVTRPLYTEGDKTVLLTATIIDGNASEEHTFFVTIAKNETKTPQEIADEVLLVATAFPNQSLWRTRDTIYFPMTGEDVDNNIYDITWESSHPEIISLDGIITQPEDADTDVTITASITVDGTEFSKEMVFTVAKLPELDGTFTSIASAIAAGEEAYVKIEGATVEGFDTNGSVYITDGTDILYIYSPRFEVVVGETYDFFGLIEFYYNAPQLDGSDTHPLLAMDSDATAVTQPTITANDLMDVIDNVQMPSTENPHVYKKFTVTASVYYEEDWGNYSVFLVPTDYDFDADLPDGATQPNGNAVMMYYKGDDEVLRAFHGQQITIDIIMQGYRPDKSVYYAVFFGTEDDVDISFGTE